MANDHNSVGVKTKTAVEDIIVYVFGFLWAPEEEQIVACPSVRPICPKNNLKTVGYNLFYLHIVEECIESECQRTITLPCLIFELLPFVHFYTLNFVRDITLIL
jgi:hypothetical protein